MRIRSAALLASRIVAIYIGFHAVIYSGEFAHDLIRRRSVAVLARSFAPLTALLALAAILWILAPRVAAALLRGSAPADANGEPDAESAGEGPLRARDAGTIAFAVSGLFIAAQAAPLLAATVQRFVGGVWNRDATGDVLALGTRVLIGVLVFVNARGLTSGVLRFRDS
ncbi:MAG TPA: hypothetical protein VGB64_09560 [Actinomycetota bacterium]